MREIEETSGIGSSAIHGHKLESRRRSLHMTPAVIIVSLAMILASALSLVDFSGGVNNGSHLAPSQTTPPSIPSGPSPVSSCFGGAPSCTGSGLSATNGEGATCIVAPFTEVAGDFMYVAISYLAGTNTIIGVSDSNLETFTFVGGEFAGQTSVAFYQVPSERGGIVTITVTLNTMEYGTCMVGQLTQGATVGVVGVGESFSSPSGTEFSLGVTNSATHHPSLLLAMFGSNRPSGGWTSLSPSGDWLSGGQQLTGYNPGTVSELFGYGDTTGGTITFSVQLAGNSVGDALYLSGIAVEIYLQPAPASNCFGGGTCVGSSNNAPQGSGTSCQISGFNEITGDFMYVAINYLGSSNVITKVSDGYATLSSIRFYSGNGESVAFYDLLAEHGGSATITVSLSATEYGTCRVGQLDPGTVVGSVGSGLSASSPTGSAFGLSVHNSGSNFPSLILALFSSDRPSGGWTSTSPSGDWLSGGQQGTGYNPGTESELLAYNDTGGGTVTFTENLAGNAYNDALYLSGIAVEFFLPLNYGWTGYENNGIYPTIMPYAVPLQILSNTAGQPSDGNPMGVSNSIAVSSYSGGIGMASESYFENEGYTGGNTGTFTIVLSFGATGLSQYYIESAEAYLVGAIELVATIPSTFPSGSNCNTGVCASFVSGVNTGINVTTSGSNQGSGEVLLEFVEEGLGIGALLAGDTFGASLAVAALLAGAAAIFISIASDIPSSSQWQSNTGPVGSGGSLNQWSEVDGGVSATCTYDYSTFSWTCPSNLGHNDFGAAETVSITLPATEVGEVQGGGVIGLSGYNQVWGDYLGLPESTDQGAFVGPLTYGVWPAEAIGGYVSHSGTNVNGALVTIIQNYNGAMTYFGVNSGAYGFPTGYWNFFANPSSGYSYSYYCTYNGVTSPTYSVPSLSAGAWDNALNAVC